MAVDHAKMLDSMYDQCSKWRSLPTEADREEYMTETLYSFGGVRPYEKAKSVMAEWKRRRASSQ